MYLPQCTSAFASSCKRVLHEPYTLHLICIVYTCTYMYISYSIPVKIPPDLVLRPVHSATVATDTTGHTADDLSDTLSLSSDLLPLPPPPPSKMADTGVSSDEEEEDEEPRSKKTVSMRERGSRKSGEREEGEEEEEEGEGGEIEDSAIKEEVGKLARLWRYVCKVVAEVVDLATEWLESTSVLYVEIVEEMKQQKIQPVKDGGEGEGEEQEEGKGVWKEEEYRASLSLQTEGKYGAIDVKAEVSEGDEEEIEKMASHGDQDTDELTPEPHTTPPGATPPPEKASKKRVHFAQSESKTIDEECIADFENELSKVASAYSERPIRFLRALKNAAMAHAEYIIYFLVILNVILNGSLLSLGYAALLFGWGLLCIPWPSKTFWLVTIFYSMLVLVVKYLFQFQAIQEFEAEDPNSGLYPPRVLGIEYHATTADFFSNAVWDMLLLIALLINRGLLKVPGNTCTYRKKRKLCGDFIRAIRVGSGLPHNKILHSCIFCTQKYT